MRFTVPTWQSSWFYYVACIETWQAEMGDTIWERGGWEGLGFLVQRKGVEGLRLAVCSVRLLGCYFIADCSQISWHQKCSVIISLEISLQSYQLSAP